MEKKSYIDQPTFKLDDFFTTQAQRDEEKKEKIEIIDLKLIDEFPNHPFKVKENEDLIKLQESIKLNGVLEPIIVRKKDDRYEIVSGHRRKKASELVGKTDIPCIIRNMTDDEKRGKFLCELRKGKKLTQQELGELVHYTDKNISKWERGVSFPNNPNVLQDLAEIFDVSIEELMYGEYKTNKNESEIRQNFVSKYTNNYNTYKKRIFIILISFYCYGFYHLLLFPEKY